MQIFSPLHNFGSYCFFPQYQEPMELTEDTWENHYKVLLE